MVVRRLQGGCAEAEPAGRGSSQLLELSPPKLGCPATRCMPLATPGACLQLSVIDGEAYKSGQIQELLYDTQHYVSAGAAAAGDRIQGPKGNKHVRRQRQGLGLNPRQVCRASLNPLLPAAIRTQAPAEVRLHRGIKAEQWAPHLQHAGRLLAALAAAAVASL